MKKAIGVIAFFLLTYSSVFAISSPYSAGETLDPACSPGETNCTVSVLPAVDNFSWNNTDNILTLSALKNTVILTKSDGTSTYYRASADTDAARGTALSSAVAASAAGDSIEVGPGDYLMTSVINIQNKQTFIFHNSRIYHTDSSINLFTANNVNDWTLKGPAIFEGSGYDMAVSGTEIGVDAYAAINFRIDGIKFQGFKNMAVKLTGISQYPRHGGQFSNTSFYQNAIGMYIDSRAEYNSFTNTDFNENDVGLVVIGGNNKFANINVTDNESYGVKLLAGTNDSHGIFTNGGFHHNAGPAVYASGISYGFTFNSVDFVATRAGENSITIENTGGLHFSGGILNTPVVASGTLTMVSVFENMYNYGSYFALTADTAQRAKIKFYGTYTNTSSNGTDWSYNDAPPLGTKGIWVEHALTDTGLVIGPSGTYGLSLWGGTSTNGTLLAGASRTSTAYTARSTSSSGINFDTGTIDFIGDTGLTSGNTFTPTSRMKILANGNVGIGTATPSQKLDIAPSGAGSGQTGTIKLRELAANGTYGVGFKAPNLLTSNTADLIWTLPAADGTNGQVLQTNGAGVLSWAANAASGMANPMTTTGDLIYASNTATPSTPARLGIGSAGQCLIVSGGLPAWGACSGSSAAAGADTQIQFNSSGSFGADAALTWNNTTKAMTLSSGTVGAYTPLYLRNTNDGTASTAGLSIGNDAAASVLSLLVNSSTYTGAGNLASVTNVQNADLSFGTNNAERMRISSAGNIGIGTASPTNILSLGGTAARTIWMERNTTSNTAGQGLTISSGGATLVSTNKGGGDLIFSSGTSTGTGTSSIKFFTATAGTSGTTDNAPTEKMTILGNGNVGIGNTSPEAKLHITYPTVASTREVFLKATVADSPNDAFFISNGTSADASFTPTFSALNATNPIRNSMAFYGFTTSGNDTGATPLVAFLTARTSSASNPLNGSFSLVANRAAFSFANWTRQLMIMMANGDIGIGTSTPVSRLDIGSVDMGAGLAGPVLTLGRNTNATNTGAGSINFLSKAGTAGYVWQDAAGNLRINTSSPSHDNDTAGVIIGAQTSIRDTKQDIQDYTDYESALEKVRNAPLHTFRYRNEVLGYGEDSPLSKTRLGFIADEVDPIFMAGNTIDQVSVNGLVLASIKALDLKLNSMNEKIETQELCLKKSDGTNVCVSAEQLENLLNNPGNTTTQVIIQNVTQTQSEPEPQPEPEPVEETVTEEETPVLEEEPAQEETIPTESNEAPADEPAI